MHLQGISRPAQSQRRRPVNPRDNGEARALPIYGDLLDALRRPDVDKARRLLAALNDAGYAVEPLEGSGGFRLVASARGGAL